MRATINGIVYEGTPEEISRTVLLQQAETKTKKWEEWQKDAVIDYFKTINTGNYKCPNEGQPCNCSGACMRPSGMRALGTTFAILDGYMNKSNT